MPMCSVKNLSARAMGSGLPSSLDAGWCAPARGRQGLGHFAFGVTRADDVAGKQADRSLPDSSTTGKVLKRKFAFLDQGEDIADELVGRNFDRILDQAVDVVFDAADLGELLALGHVVMDEAEAAVEGHGDGHARFGDGVHVRRR
jgi:hypothetical protein